MDVSDHDLLIRIDAAVSYIKKEFDDFKETADSVQGWARCATHKAEIEALKEIKPRVNKALILAGIAIAIVLFLVSVPDSHAAVALLIKLFT